MTRRSLPMLLVPAALIAVVAGLFGTASSQDKPAGAPKGGVYEMRTYTTHPGKLDALNARFRDHTLKLFEKHGMTNIGYWTAANGENADRTLIYIMAYPSREAREASWKAFGADAVWQKVAADSQADGVRLAEKVDSRYIVPTDFSPLK